jgi:hypothetical protein
MTQAIVLDRGIARLIKAIMSEAAAKGARELRTWKRPEQEIKQLFESDYAYRLRATFGRGEVRSLVRVAAAIWPNFNRGPMGPPSMGLFAEVSEHLRLIFSAAPYRKRGGFAVRGFYIKSLATLGKPLIYVNSAHHPLAVGTAFCHEVGHHLTADMFRASGATPQAPRLFFGAEYSAHMDDPVEMAADIMVSLAGYPGPIARKIFRSASTRSGIVLPFGARGGEAFDTVRGHLLVRYGFDFTAALPPTRKLHYLTGMIHYARLREALLTEYDL